MVFGVVGDLDHSFDAAASKAARQDNAIDSFKYDIEILVFQCFRIDPANIDFGLELESSVIERFRNGEIGIVKLHIFSH